jgi:hypothetical protein
MLGDNTFDNPLELSEAKALSSSSEDLPILIIQKNKQENKMLAFANIKVFLVFPFWVSIGIFL